MIIDSDSEPDLTFPDEDADITDGDKKMAAVDKTPDKHRKEVAKVMASLQQTPTLYDTEKQVAHKDPKVRTCSFLSSLFIVFITFSRFLNTVG